MKKILTSLALIVVLGSLAVFGQVTKEKVEAFQAVPFASIEARIPEGGSPLVVTKAESRFADRERLTAGGVAVPAGVASMVSYPDVSLTNIGDRTVESFTILLESKGQILNRSIWHMRHPIQPGGTFAFKSIHWIKWEEKTIGSADKGFEKALVEPAPTSPRLWVAGTPADISVRIAYITFTDGTAWDFPQPGGIARCEKHMPIQAVRVSYPARPAYRLVAGFQCSCSCGAQCILLECHCTVDCAPYCGYTQCNVCAQSCCVVACGEVLPCKIV